MIRKLVLTGAIISIILSAFFWWKSHRERNPIGRASSELDSLISSERIGDLIGIVAARLHRAGTVENRSVGDVIIKRLTDAGLKVTTTQMEASLFEPVEARLTLTAPTAIDFDLREKIFEQDTFSIAAASDLPFFAYSPDCDLEAQVVYANFGDREDYAHLRRNGISLAGKIALVRAQGICRSMKARIAKEEGVAGLLLYPELRDQGFKKLPYPEGPHINPWVIQRGSMLQYFINPGDPFSDENQTESVMPGIPSLPISENIATRILNAVGGSPSPAEWQGWLPTPYNMGPGPAQAKMIFKGRIAKKTIRNIIAKFTDAEPVNPYVLVGGHYDAWTFGAADPGSGTAVLLETAEALAKMRKTWWRPQNEIVFAFWDAEELGMFGSTAWVKSQQEKIQEQVAAYINVDTAVKGRDFAGYVMPGLRYPLDEVLSYVRDPVGDRLLFDLRGEYQLPGFSDDTAPFTGFAGTLSAEIHFGRTYSMYHSIYDDPVWMQKFGDPGFRYSAALAKILTLYVMKLAGEDVIPYEFSEISTYVRENLEQIRIHQPGLYSRTQPDIQTLIKAMDGYDAAVKQLRTVTEESNKKSKQTLLDANLRLIKVITLFTSGGAGQKTTFGKRNQLLGPSELTGCGGEAIPQIQNAFRSEIQEEIQSRIKDLTGSFLMASDQLAEVRQILEK